MLIDAVIEKGQVRLLNPVKFVHDYFTVKVDIPEKEIANYQSMVKQQNEPIQLTGDAAEFKQLTNSLFDSQYRYIPEKLDNEILVDELSKKYA